MRNTIPYHNCVGLAISENNGKSYKKFSDGPLWDRDYKDPYYSGTSCVLIDDNKWKNWYLSVLAGIRLIIEWSLDTI